MNGLLIIVKYIMIAIALYVALHISKIHFHILSCFILSFSLACLDDLYTEIKKNKP